MSYATFVDVSGGVRDSFTAAVAHVEDGFAVLLDRNPAAVQSR